MSVHPPFAAVVRQMWPKLQPRTPKVKNPGESRTRAIVAARCGGVCEVCGSARAESVHHLRKRSQGGPWSPQNCVGTCGDGARGCHGWITGNPHAAHEEGWHLERGEAPGSRPILSRLHGPVWLLANGGLSPAVWLPCRRCGCPLAPGYRCGDAAGQGPYHLVCVPAAPIEGAAP